jgi:hypothetical protein
MRKWRQNKEPKKADFGFEGRAPQLDLLDYRYMDIEMTKSASTDTGCMSLVAILGLGFICVAATLLLAYWARV